MSNVLRTCWKILKVGGWAPLLVFATHVFIDRVLDAYSLWPPIDVPMHFLGGMAIAFFISRCFQVLPREAAQKGRIVVLELLLVGSLTASAAVFWEFSEFTVDQLFHSNIQISLANTMKDMSMGIFGSIVFILIRPDSCVPGQQSFGNSRAIGFVGKHKFRNCGDWLAKTTSIQKSFKKMTTKVVTTNPVQNGH